MSEPLSSVEIEDVLSSIRRLVSEDLRPSEDVPIAPTRAHPEVVSSHGGLLLLTASQRVAEPVAAGERRPDDAPSRTIPGKAAAAEPSPPLRRVPDAATNGQPPEGEKGLAASGWAMPAGTQTADDDEPGDALPAAPRHRFSFSVARAAFDEEEDAPDAPADPLPHERPPRLDLTAEFAVSSPPWAQPVTDGPQESAGQGEDRPTAATSRHEAETPPDDFDWVDTAARAAIRDIEQTVTDAVEREIEITGIRTATISQLRPAGPRPDQPPPDRAEPGPGAATNGDIEEPEEELFIEEEALREIIRDVVREELAGSLGARITRNVRKLIRAEISQALAARMLE